MASPFTQLVGCPLPLQQAAMGGVATPELVTAVAREGALGMLPAAGLSQHELRRQFEVCVAAAGPDARIGIGFLMPFLDRSAFEAAVEIAPIIECFYADPDQNLAELAHDAGALMAWQVGSRTEAVAAEAAGCDLIVVQGREAGGHVRGNTRLLNLLDEICDTVRVPVVASGGIGTRDHVVEAMNAGADAVRVGTRFLASVEADAHSQYVQALVRADATDTVLTESFSMGWPNAPHRVLRSCVAASHLPATARSPLPPTTGFRGEVGAAALYAGKSVAAIAGVEPAAAIIRELVG